jgi:hypothetical protein
MGEESLRVLSRRSIPSTPRILNKDHRFQIDRRNRIRIMVAARLMLPSAYKPWVMPLCWHSWFLRGVSSQHVPQYSAFRGEGERLRRYHVQPSRYPACRAQPACQAAASEPSRPAGSAFIDFLSRKYIPVGMIAAIACGIAYPPLGVAAAARQMQVVATVGIFVISGGAQQAAYLCLLEKHNCTTTM